MAMIKSALELALERTKNLKVDENALQANQIKTEGKRAAGKFLDDSNGVDLGTAIQNVDQRYREQFRKAVFEVLIGQVQLPTGHFDAEKLASIGAGLGTVARMAPTHGGVAGPAAEKKVVGLIQQISAFFSKYLDEIKRIEQAIRTQWAPKLKEKERQLSARMGQEVRFDPMSDPEFSAFYKQNVEALRDNYRNALEKAKGDLSTLCGIPQEEKGT